MRKAILLVVLAGLVVSSAAVPAAQAKKKAKKAKPRVVEIEYSHPGIGVAPAAGYPVQFPLDADIPTTTSELFIKIEVTDMSGQKVAGFIAQADENGDGLQDGFGDFCGAHPAAVPLRSPGGVVNVYAFSGFCADLATPSVMTTGTIKITFSGKP